MEVFLLTAMITPYDEDELLKEVEQRCQASFEFFLNIIRVKSATGPQQFLDCMAVHQRRCFNDLVPQVEKLRDGENLDFSRFWIERTKKASKDSDIALVITWLLAFPKRPFLIQVGAGDKEQAAIVRSRIEDILYYNPWLRRLVSVTKYHGTGANGLATLEIEAADIEGSHGATPDLLVCNELSHVKKWEFVSNLLANADGVANGMVIVATNAGHIGTEAWKMRESVVKNPRWVKHIFSRPAPWHNDEFIEDAKQRDPLTKYNRLWWGIWASGKGDAFDGSLIDKVLVPGLKPLEAPEVGWSYVGGVDLGVQHDHSGVVVLGVNKELQRIRLATFKGFEPVVNGEVDLIAVRDFILGTHRLFHVIDFGYDPHQCELMAQELRREGVCMRRVNFTGNNLTIMATALKSLLESKTQKFEAYDDEDQRIRNDLGKFNIVERSYGFRLMATSDSTGHADVGTALAIAIPRAVQLLGSNAITTDDDAAYDDDKPLTKEELDSMSPEMRDIFDAYDNSYGGSQRYVIGQDRLW